MAERIFLAPAVFLEFNGVGRYFYRGTEVPEEGLLAGDIRTLEASGAIGEREVEAGVPVEPALPEGTPTTKWTVAQVDAYAASRGINLSEVKTKADKVAVITDVEDVEAVAPQPQGDVVGEAAPAGESE
jgi:hypothetical protein